MHYNGGIIAAKAEWGDIFFTNHHRQFVKGGPLWRHHRLQRIVYMAKFCPCPIGNTASNSVMPTSNLPKRGKMIV